MRLALFDLDNTLLEGDSDHAWGQYLIQRGLVTAQEHASANDAFYQQYLDGVLDIHAYVAFTLNPVINLNISALKELHNEFMLKFVEPIILPQALKLVEDHRKAGDFCAIITATNTFITSPIAKRFEVDLLLGTDLETRNDKFTGKILGTPCFQAGKVDKLTAWIGSQQSKFELSDSIFYSDSINDLPLLEKVGQAVAVDADDKLSAEAKSRRWKHISLRDEK